jgi:aminoglycoside phosphotransferase (APT) family kinase protein
MATPHFSFTDVVRVVATIFGSSLDSAIARMGEGHSTFVYRVRRGEMTWYLRVLPEEGDSFAPEARVHALLRERGVRVPDVLYWEDRNPLLQRSVMVTSEIPGQPVSRHAYIDTLPAILAEAGCDLARVNSVPVAGFGWIRRDASVGPDLEAELPSLRAFVLEEIEERLAFLADRRLLDVRQTDAIGRIIEARSDWLDAPDAHLAHGDFDATHIYHDQGRYTGVIDFGEIRGADPFYDLGHFFMESRALLPPVLAGYGEIISLPSDAMARIHFASIFIRIRRAVIDTQKHGAPYPGTITCIGENIAALVGP